MPFSEKKYPFFVLYAIFDRKSVKDSDFLCTATVIAPVVITTPPILVFPAPVNVIAPAKFVVPIAPVVVRVAELVVVI